MNKQELITPRVNFMTVRLGVDRFPNFSRHQRWPAFSTMHPKFFKFLLTIEQRRLGLPYQGDVNPPGAVPLKTRRCGVVSGVGGETAARSLAAASRAAGPQARSRWAAKGNRRRVDEA